MWVLFLKFVVVVGWTLERLALSALSVGSGVDFSFRSAVNGELSRCKSWAAFRILHPTRLNVRSITCYDHNQPHIVPHRLTSQKILPNTKTSPGSLGFYMRRLCYTIYSLRLQWIIYWCWQKLDLIFLSNQSLLLQILNIIFLIFETICYKNLGSARLSRLSVSGSFDRIRAVAHNKNRMIYTIKSFFIVSQL